MSIENTMDLSVPNSVHCCVLFVVLVVVVAMVCHLLWQRITEQKMSVWSRCLCHFCIINLFHFEVGFKRCTDKSMFFSAYYSFSLFTAKMLAYIFDRQKNVCVSTQMSAQAQPLYFKIHRTSLLSVFFNKGKKRNIREFSSCSFRTAFFKLNKRLAWTIGWPKDCWLQLSDGT